MEEKKQPRLFTWRQGIIMGMAAAGGIILNAYRTYKAEGHLDATWVVIAIITLTMCGAIFFFVARYGNKPEKGA